MSNKKSAKREAARRKRNARGWSTRSNRSPSSGPDDRGVTEQLGPKPPLPAMGSIDAPASQSVLERMPPAARWIGLVVVAVVIGALVGVNHTVQLGLTAGLATLLAGGAFLAAFLPPSLRERPGDGAAVGFGRATGHERPPAEETTQPEAPTNRAARRRARKQQK